VTPLLKHLEDRRAQGRKLLVPYLMAGAPEPEVFSEAAAAVAEHADALEIGLPYSDPLMDGPVIAAAGARAIAGGVGPSTALGLAGGLDLAVPRIVMTYYNPIHAAGEQAFCASAAAAGVAGLIVPDLPVEESASLRAEAAGAGLAWIPLVSPTSSPDRVARVAETATGFVYAVSTLGVTGTRTQLSERAAAVAGACREATDLPVLVGIGVSTPAQAVEASGHADGVVVGSAVVKLLEERGVRAAAALVGEIRTALDRA
jgi:tryptophan synthase alpha chain